MSSNQPRIPLSDRPRILVLDRLEPSALQRLEAAGDVTVVPEPDSVDVAAMIASYDAVVIRTSACLTSAVLDKAAKLRAIGRAGVGLDNIDLEAARCRGITVVHTPESGTEAVADLTIGMLLCCLRRIHEVHAEVLAGRHQQARSLPPARQMSEMTIGIVGMGRIGRAVGRRCRWGFGMRVVYADIMDVGRIDFVAEPMGFEALLRVADVVSLHVPLTELTRGMVCKRTIDLMKPDSILINTARGAVVDCADLAAALAAGRLAAAAIDVLDVEPPPPDHPLLQAPRVLLTPHIGARTLTAQARMSDVVDDVLAVLAGRTPRFPAW
ncbi:MAG: hypothetical protein IT449_13820 [Phycisphaerales bacterium]|nr:hypothetical protein [Phycisphaerales bacterium]